MISITFQFVMFSFIFITISWGPTPRPISTLVSIIILLIFYYEMHTFSHRMWFGFVKRFLVFSENRRTASWWIWTPIQIFIIIRWQINSSLAYRAQGSTLHICIWFWFYFLLTFFCIYWRSTSGRGMWVSIIIFVLVTSMWCWTFMHMSVSRLPVMWCSVATTITVNKCTSALMWQILLLNLPWW